MASVSVISSSVTSSISSSSSSSGMDSSSMGADSRRRRFLYARFQLVVEFVYSVGVKVRFQDRHQLLAGELAGLFALFDELLKALLNGLFGLFALCGLCCLGGLFALFLLGGDAGIFLKLGFDFGFRRGFGFELVHRLVYGLLGAGLFCGSRCGLLLWNLGGLFGLFLCRLFDLCCGSLYGFCGGGCFLLCGFFDLGLFYGFVCLGFGLFLSCHYCCSSHTLCSV